MQVPSTVRRTMDQRDRADPPPAHSPKGPPVALARRVRSPLGDLHLRAGRRPLHEHNVRAALHGRCDRVGVLPCGLVPPRVVVHADRARETYRHLPLHSACWECFCRIPPGGGVQDAEWETRVGGVALALYHLRRDYSALRVACLGRAARLSEHRQEEVVVDRGRGRARARACRPRQARADGRQALLAYP